MVSIAFTRDHDHIKMELVFCHLLIMSVGGLGRKITMWNNYHGHLYSLYLYLLLYSKTSENRKLDF